MTKAKDWFKLKRYPHIGFPIKPQERTNLEKYVLNPDVISKHSFLPFIHKTSKVRKFRKKYSLDDGKAIKTCNNKVQDVFRHASVKDRELYYAGHLDSLIYSYYSQIINDKYEGALKHAGLNEIVTAYRRIKIDEHSLTSGHKCNIDFAVDFFKTIKSYERDKFVVIAFDISGFFDNLNHKILLKNWKSILGFDGDMKPDHFNVFKSITRFTYIDLVDIFNKFQKTIFYTGSENGKPVIKRKYISKIKYLRKEKAIAFCTKKEFLNERNKIIRQNRYYKNIQGNTEIRNFGIPQGSPISSVLANLYMLNFDEEINTEILDKKGQYRRYSDDMVVICPLDQKASVIKLFKKKISELKLEIKDEKTQIFHFERNGNKLTCGQEFKTCINADKKFTYLGFEFDGDFIYVKSGSISKYYRKMKRAIKRAKHYSLHPLNKNPEELFKSRLLKKYSYKGAARRRKYIYNEKKKYFEVTNHYDWGNFLSYTYKAKNIRMKNKIHNQMKKHWVKINKLIFS